MSMILGKPRFRYKKLKNCIVCGVEFKGCNARKICSVKCSLELQKGKARRVGIMREKRNCVVCAVHRPEPIPLHSGRNKVNMWEIVVKKTSIRKCCSTRCSRINKFQYTQTLQFKLKAKRNRDKNKVLHSCVICQGKFKTIDTTFRKTCYNSKCVKTNCDLIQVKWANIPKNRLKNKQACKKYRKSHPLTPEQKQRQKIRGALRWKKHALENKERIEFNRAVKKIKRDNLGLYNSSSPMTDVLKDNRAGFRYKLKEKKKNSNLKRPWDQNLSEIEVR